MSQRDLQLSFQDMNVVAARLAAAAWRLAQSSFIQVYQAFPYLLVIHFHISCFRVHDKIKPTFQTLSMNTETVSGGCECILIHIEHTGIEQKGVYLAGQSSVLHDW